MGNFLPLLGGVIEEYLPRLLGGLGVLAAGWVIAMLAAHLMRRILHRSLLDDRLAEAISSDEEEAEETTAAIDVNTERLVLHVMLLLSVIVTFRLIGFNYYETSVRALLFPLLDDLSLIAGRTLEYVEAVDFLHGIMNTVFATLGLILVFRVFHRVFPPLITRIDVWWAMRFKTVKVQDLELLTAQHIANATRLAIRVLRFALSLIAVLIYVSAVFNFFPGTKGAAATLVSVIFVPLESLWKSFVHFLPNIVFIAIIAVLTRLLIRGIRIFFEAVDERVISVAGFYPEWAMPTFHIVRFAVLTFAVILIFPYLPGSGSLAFQAVGVFLGLLISLGSSSAVSNVIAGLVLTYMRPYRIGDRVQIADHIGDVTERSLLVTRIRTIHNEDITIPNATIMGTHIVNYSKTGQSGRLILKTTVTISYAAPWRDVHALLIAAAQETPDILAEPEPYILQKSLDDFFVSYELNAFTAAPNRMHFTYSALHEAIQDQFNAAGMEIMSPHYTSLRDGNRMAIPDESLPEGYQVPGFKIK
jgi:small-conductance mechanosensitive channel